MLGMVTGKLRSRMPLNFHFLDLWGIMANGEIFSFAGGFFLISLHRCTLACPLVTLSAIPNLNCAMALGSNADEWGPFLTAAWSSAYVQSRPVLTGQPTVACFLSMLPAGCFDARFVGYISPRCVGVLPRWMIVAGLLPLCIVQNQNVWRGCWLFKSFLHCLFCRFRIFCPFLLLFPPYLLTWMNPWPMIVVSCAAGGLLVATVAGLLLVAHCICWTCLAYTHLKCFDDNYRW